jgi:hypothetical protein
MIMHDIINKVDIAQFRGDLKSAILDYFGLTIGDHYSEENFLINSELIFNLLKDSGVSHHQ